MAKFHESAITLYGVSQTAENVSAIQDSTQTTGTVTITLAGTSAIGVGTLFLTEVAVGSYLFDSTGAIAGQVESVTDDLNIVLSASEVVITGASFATGLGPKNALAALNLNYSTELTSEAHTFVGDELSRDEETVITDKYAVFDFEVFLPKRGDLAGAEPTADEVPMADWFASSGLAILLSEVPGAIDITNGTSTNDYMTIEVRRSSPDIITDKCYTMSNCRGTIDLDATVGTRAKLKFNYNGNLVDVTQKDPLIADYQDQKSGHAGSINADTVTLSNLELWDGATAPTGPYTTNFCFDKLLVPNVDGFAYDRYQTSCENGWSKGATPYDVTATIIEDSADAIYNPDNHLEENHQLLLNYGSAAGSLVELTWYKLQLGGITASTVAKYSAQDLAFRCVGNFLIRLL